MTIQSAQILNQLLTTEITESGEEWLKNTQEVLQLELKASPYKYIHIATAIFQQSGDYKLLPAFMVQVSTLDDPLEGISALKENLFESLTQEQLLIRSYLIGYVDAKSNITVVEQKPFELTIETLSFIIPTDDYREIVSWIEDNLSYTQVRNLADGSYKDSSYGLYAEALADEIIDQKQKQRHNKSI